MAMVFAMLSASSRAEMDSWGPWQWKCTLYNKIQNSYSTMKPNQLLLLSIWAAIQCLSNYPYISKVHSGSPLLVCIHVEHLLKMFVIHLIRKQTCLLMCELLTGQMPNRHQELTVNNVHD